MSSLGGDRKALVLVVNGRVCDCTVTLIHDSALEVIIDVLDISCLRSVSPASIRTPLKIAVYSAVENTESSLGSAVAMIEGSPVSITDMHLIEPRSSKTSAASLVCAQKMGEANFRVGIMYEGWHAPACQALLVNTITSPISIEQVIRNMSTLTVEEAEDQYNGQSFAFTYHTIPENGPYCIYKKRPNETEGYVPDCLNITGTLTMHANMLMEAGIDYVVADATNLPSPGPMQPPACPDCQGDLLQLRPIEVLFEEWALLRSQGVQTPQIAVWQTIAGPDPTEWWYMLQRLYLNASYADLIMTDAATGKPVFFIPSQPEDPSLITEIESYGVVVIQIWANLSPAQFASGEWVFMSPCTAGTGGSSTNVVGAPCNQFITTNSAIGPSGTAITVGPSYQLGYSSLPFQAAGKLNGYTLQQQFVKAFSTPVDYMFVGTFNEAIAQPQPNPYIAGTPQAISMGLVNDPDGSQLWVDMYGGEISRDLQPTQEYGSFYWDLLNSCLRVYALAQGMCKVMCLFVS